MSENFFMVGVVHFLCSEMEDFDEFCDFRPGDEGLWKKKIKKFLFFLFLWNKHTVGVGILKFYENCIFLKFLKFSWSFDEVFLKFFDIFRKMSFELGDQSEKSARSVRLCVECLLCPTSWVSLSPRLLYDTLWSPWKREV